MSNSVSPSALGEFVEGVEQRMEGSESLLNTPKSDRALAAIAWPDAEEWEALSPEATENAIRQQLEKSS